MIKALETEPWRGLPPEVAELIEPELPATTEEILATIAREVPEYARPLEGSFGRGIRVGVTEALRQFVELVRDPGAGRGPGRDVYVGLGRGELREGRTLDSLQSAYRVGARVAWRRLSVVARKADLAPDALALLAESIFAYIDELSADSVEGFTEAQRELEGERQRRRRALATLLVRETPVAEADVRAAAQAAGWALPRLVAAIACSEANLGRLSRRLPADALTASLEGVGCALVGDPAGPGRAEELRRAGEGMGAAIGPAGERSELAASWSLSQAALRAAEAGVLESGRLLRAEDHLAELLLFVNRPLVDAIAARRLAPLGELTPKARTRMEETALAYVQHGGNATAMAPALYVHPQTVRYRIARLRELLGEDLDDPSSRFELELALRARAFATPARP